MAWKFNFTTTGKYPTIVHKFLVDYPRGGEVRSRAKHTVGGVSEAVEVDGVLWGRRRRCASGEVVEVNGVPWGQRRRRAPGKVVEVDDVLQGQRRRRAPCEAVEVDDVLRG
jgi:hypothetical protein